MHVCMGHRTSLRTLFFVGISAMVAAQAATAHAEEEIPTIALKPPPEQPKGPNAMLAVTGLVIFGVPYGFSAAAAATSNVSSDKWLYVPIVGPWGDIIARQTCTSSGCKGDFSSAAAPLVISGLGQ